MGNSVLGPVGMRNWGEEMRTEVCIVSEYEISREGLKNILKAEGFEVVGAFSDVAEAINGDLPDEVFIILDGFPVADQPSLVKELLTHFESSLVAVLSERFELNPMMECFHHGARGYIVRSMKALPMTTSLRLTAMGERVLPSDLVDVLDQRPALAAPQQAAEAMSSDTAGPSSIDMAETPLSPRERDVLRCLMAGYSNKLIARRLVVCEATVKVHVKAILRKLNVNNRTQAAIWASSRGISDHQPAA